MKKLVHIKTNQADLASHYKRDFMVSVIMVLLILIAIFRIEFNPQVEIKLSERQQDIIQLEDIIQTSQTNLPPPPPRPRLPEQVPNETIVEDDVFNFDFEQTDITLPPPPPPASAEAEEDEPEFFVSVEQMPYIIGGMDALYRALEYPELARRAGIEGRVVVQFIIDEKGNVHNPRVVRGAGAGLDEAAVRAIMQISFEPGRQRGRAVPVQYTIPVNFQLDRGV